MSKVPVLPPSGFRDFLPGEASARLHLVETISRIYQSHGFQPIGISMMENLSTLQGKGGGSDNEKLIFKVLKRGEDLERSLAGGEAAALSDLGLRFDLTLPLARYCSRFREQLPKPFKVFQIGPVWRADRPQKGRFREFYQCDVDIVGSKEIGAEVDCLSAILEVFGTFGLDGIELHLNDRRLLSALKEKDMSDAEWAEALVMLDKLDKIGQEGVRKELTAKFGKIPSGLEKILRNETASIESFSPLHEESVQSIREILSTLQALLPEVKFLFNPTLVRGQDYYTGTIFEVRHSNISGSLAGGGRYNRLLEIFGGADTPAFGGSIGFERLFLLLQESGRIGEMGSNPQVFFPLFHESLREAVFRIASGLRKRGIRADVFPDSAKLKNQFRYADERGIPFVASLGEEEWKKKEIKVKEMSSREETSVALEPFEQFLDKMEQICNQQKRV